MGIWRSISYCRDQECDSGTGRSRRVLHFGMTSSALAQNSLPDAAKLKALRKHTSLSKAQVTVFTHLPLIGVSSVTDPTGKTLYYEYDELGRLKRNYYYENNIMQESEKRVLQEYDYHYRNQ